MSPVIFRALAYVLIGMTLEVCFTALKQLIFHKSWKLQGYTQLWVIPIYSICGIFIFEPLYLSLADQSFWIRGTAYALAIFASEFVMGFICEHIIGYCAWRYKQRGNIRGYIYPPYFPFWFTLGLFLERVYDFLIRIYP